MTTNDQTIPADKVRAVVNSWETTRPEHRTIEDAEGIIRALRDMLPTPPRPTLAGMTKEERDACLWMQCDVEGEESRAVITSPYWASGIARVISPSGSMGVEPWKRVTPRPDLPRMEWPGDQKAVPVDAVEVGDIIVSADDPRLSALPVGSVLLDRDGVTTTKREDGRWAGFGHMPIPAQGDKFGPWTVRRIGWEADQ